MIRTNKTMNIPLQTLSSLVSRAKLFSSLTGQSFNGERNLYEALGYPLSLNYNDYAARYTRQDIAKAIIDRPVNATWQGGITISEVKEVEDTPLEIEWKKLEERLQVSSRLARADKLAGLGRYGVLFLGLDDVTKQEDLVNPVVSGKRTLKYLKAFGEGSALIDQYETNPKSERFGLPKIYNITLKQVENQAQLTVRVHYTRVIHIVEDPLESDIEGAPRLEALFNRLMDIEKIVGGDGEMFWKGARPGYQGKIDKDFQMTSTMETDLKDQLDEMEHNLRRYLLNEGITWEALEQQLSDPTAHVQVQLQMVSALTGIPLRVLIGSERGNLASEQDAAEWKTFVVSRREGYAGPRIVRPFIDRLVELKILPAPVTKTYTIKWSDVFAVSEADRVKIGMNRAAAIRDYIQNPIALEVMPPEAFEELCLGLTDEQKDLVKLLREKGIESELSSVMDEQGQAQQQIQNPVNKVKRTR